MASANNPWKVWLHARSGDKELPRVRLYLKNECDLIDPDASVLSFSNKMAHDDFFDAATDEAADAHIGAHMSGDTDGLPEVAPLATFVLASLDNLPSGHVSLEIEGEDPLEMYSPVSASIPIGAPQAVHVSPLGRADGVVRLMSVPERGGSHPAFIEAKCVHDAGAGLLHVYGIKARIAPRAIAEKSHAQRALDAFRVQAYLCASLEADQSIAHTLDTLKMRDIGELITAATLGTIAATAATIAANVAAVTAKVAATVVKVVIKVSKIVMKAIRAGVKVARKAIKVIRKIRKIAKKIIHVGRRIARGISTTTQRATTFVTNFARGTAQAAGVGVRIGASVGGAFKAAGRAAKSAGRFAAKAARGAGRMAARGARTAGRFAKRTGRMAKSGAEKARGLATKGFSKTKALAGRLRTKASDLRKKASEKFKSAKSRVKQFTGKVKERAGKIKQKVSDLRKKAGEKAKALKEKAGAKIEALKGKVKGEGDGAAGGDAGGGVGGVGGGIPQFAEDEGGITGVAEERLPTVLPPPSQASEVTADQAAVLEEAVAAGTITAAQAAAVQAGGISTSTAQGLPAPLLSELVTASPALAGAVREQSIQQTVLARNAGIEGLSMTLDDRVKYLMTGQLPPGLTATAVPVTAEAPPEEPLPGAQFAQDGMNQEIVGVPVKMLDEMLEARRSNRVLLHDIVRTLLRLPYRDMTPAEVARFGKPDFAMTPAEIKDLGTRMLGQLGTPAQPTPEAQAETIEAGFDDDEEWDGDPAEIAGALDEGGEDEDYDEEYTPEDLDFDGALLDTISDPEDDEPEIGDVLGEADPRTESFEARLPYLVGKPERVPLHAALYLDERADVVHKVFMEEKGVYGAMANAYALWAPERMHTEFCDTPLAHILEAMSDESDALGETELGNNKQAHDFVAKYTKMLVRQMHVPRLPCEVHGVQCGVDVV